MEALAARGHGVYLLVNEEFSYPFSRVAPIHLHAPYTHGQKYPVSWMFRKAVKKQVQTIRSKVPHPDWILIFSETNLAAALFLKQELSSKILYGHRSNTVRESVFMLQTHKRNPLKSVKYLIDIAKYTLYERTLARGADILVFQSEYDRSDFLNRNGKARDISRVIGGHIGPPWFKKETEGINSSTRLERLLFVGTTGPRKGLRYLLEALRLLRTRGIGNLTLDVVGPGGLKNHLEFLDRHGLREQVRFHGRVTDPYPFYKMADLLVVPSVFDSYPNTVLEALHSGIPVIASSVGGIPEMLKDPELLFPPCDSEALATILEKIYLQEEYYARVRELCQGLSRFFYFDWAGEWEKLLKS